jgi:hypothetical protein
MKVFLITEDQYNSLNEDINELGLAIKKTGQYTYLVYFTPKLKVLSFMAIINEGDFQRSNGVYSGQKGLGTHTILTGVSIVNPQYLVSDNPDDTKPAIKAIYGKLSNMDNIEKEPIDFSKTNRKKSKHQQLNFMYKGNPISYFQYVQNGNEYLKKYKVDVEKLFKRGFNLYKEALVDAELALI